jgi:hypothetical protein
VSQGSSEVNKLRLTLQVVRNRVVRHVDGRIAEGLDQERRVPRQLGSETIRAGTCPLVQPSKGTFERVAGFGAVCSHLGNESDKS